jgi:hypothetical protein
MEKEGNAKSIPKFKKKNSELLIFRTTFQSFTKAAMKDGTWILWQEVVFITICVIV